MPPTEVASPDGTRLAVYVSGQGPPLVLVHGTTANHRRWDPVLAGLEAGHTVFAMDRRGTGASGDAPTYSVAREFEDVAAVVDHAARTTRRPVRLLGHSFGAYCCLGAALRTRAVERLVLYEPIVWATNVYPAGFLDRLDALVASHRREEAVLALFSEILELPPQRIDELRAQPLWKDRVRAAHTIAREGRAEEMRPFEPEDVGRLDVPVLLLAGSDSPASLRESTEALRQAIPQSRVAVLQGHAHNAMQTGPDAFLQAVLPFLAGRKA